MRRRAKQDATARKAALWFVRNRYRYTTPNSRQKFHNWLARDQKYQKQYQIIYRTMRKTDIFTKSPLCEKIYGDMLDAARGKPDLT